MKYAVLGVTLAVLSGCAGGSSSESTQVVVEKQYVTRDPGAVEYIWEPPMVDVVDVPPGLDPEGHYYRPAHQEVTEIRQGKWKYYKEAEEEDERSRSR
jgi:nucleoside phosphorylase